jgi:Lipocalin-like domain
VSSPGRLIDVNASAYCSLTTTGWRSSGARSHARPLHRGIVGDVDASENPLVGAWRLVSCETRADDGSVDYPLGRDAVGKLIYTDDGHMSVSIARPSRRPFAGGDLLGGTGDEKAEAVESYVSYCGRYERRDESVVHQVEMSLFPNWTGRDQERRVKLDGKRLTLEAPPFTIKGAEQRAYLVWERC